MGYEIKLIIGRSGRESDEVKSGDLIIEDDCAYRPLMKDSDGKFIKTGRKEVYFRSYAEIDMCKMNYNGAFHKALGSWKNTDDKTHWFFYGIDGNNEVREDRYSEKWTPQNIGTVLDVLKDEAKADDYRRLKWAIALLESMKEDAEGLQVLIYAH